MQGQVKSTYQKMLDYGRIIMSIDNIYGRYQENQIKTAQEQGAKHPKDFKINQSK